ncbi:MAG TPA: hypothetical protein VMH79_15645 [Thermoanaerobaculia bacterium]|nr:hypothetical protein [Thermoanaerobaculia bacterium]
MTGRFRTVNAILEQVGASRPARKGELGCGDYVVVTTENSVYSIQVLAGSTYRVRGGWFDRQHLSPVTLSIAGCTWGGSVIKNDIVAACGLHLEFGNRLLTSRIRDVLVIRAGAAQEESLRPIHSPELLTGCYGARWEAVSAA